MDHLHKPVFLFKQKPEKAERRVKFVWTIPRHILFSGNRRLLFNYNFGNWLLDVGGNAGRKHFYTDYFAITFLPFTM